MSDPFTLKFLAFLIFFINFYLIMAFFYFSYKKKRKRLRYLQEFNEIIPDIEIHPNPNLGTFFYKLGGDLINEDDVHLKLAGSCLMNFDILLREKVKDDIKYDKNYIKDLQNNVLSLKNGIIYGDKNSLINSIFRFYWLLYKFDSPEVNSVTCDKLNKFLMSFVSHNVKDNFLKQYIAMSIRYNRKNDVWNYENLKNTNVELIFVYDCFKRFMLQFYKDHPSILSDYVELDNINKIRYFQYNIYRSIKNINNQTMIYYLISEIYRRNIKKIDPYQNKLFDKMRYINYLIKKGESPIYNKLKK